MTKIQEIKRDDSNDYVKIIRALLEIPFPVGRKLIIDFLNGNYKNPSITKNNLDEKPSFDSLHWDSEKISEWIDRLISNKMIEQIPADYNKFIRLLRVTIKGQTEAFRPTINKQHKALHAKTPVTEEDQDRFNKYDSFLKSFNTLQKKSIVTPSKNTLCIAGAGSGKTMVLTKRIEFLIKEMGVKPESILAITFTKKAKAEMISRLEKYDVHGVKVHTFNSFCENILRQYEHKIYSKKMRVLSYADKILALNLALANQGKDIQQVIDFYFSDSQKENKSQQQLINSFMNDCFSVLEHFKAKK